MAAQNSAHFPGVYSLVETAERTGKSKDMLRRLGKKKGTPPGRRPGQKRGRAAYLARRRESELKQLRGLGLVPAYRQRLIVARGRGRGAGQRSQTFLAGFTEASVKAYCKRDLFPSLPKGRMTTVEVAGEIGCHRSWVIKLVEQGFLRGERLQPVGPGLRRRWSIESASVEDLKTALRGRKPRRGPNKIKKRLEELRAAAGRGNGQPAPRNGQPVRAKKQRAAPRLQLDPLTHSVRLDDKLLGSDIRPKPFRFFERIAKANGDLVSGQELRKLPGLAGVMFFRLLDQLPLPVRRLVKSASRAGGGYWLQLPTKRCSSV